MTSEEVIANARGALEDIEKKHAPTEEMLRAVLELGQEKESLINEVANLKGEVARLMQELALAKQGMQTERGRAAKAEKSAKDQAWVAQELGKFICDIANGVHEGREKQAARSVYDLNKGSIRRQRRNAADYDSWEEAKAAFAKQSRTADAPITDSEVIEWLFMFAD